MKQTEVSIIVPAYNEDKVIKKTLSNLVVEMGGFSYPFEILVVADGCRDRTVEEAQLIKDERVRVLSYTQNQGKGYAIKYGVRHAKGNVVTFYDAGGDFDPSHIDRFVKLLEVFDADIVIGSKHHPASVVDYPLKRRIFSSAYHGMVNVMFGLKVSDTQTGLKVLKREVADQIFPRVVVKQYAFDLEMLVVARTLGYKRIFEAPVYLQFNDLTSGINWKTIRKMLTDTAAIYYRKNILKYYDRPAEFHQRKNEQLFAQSLERRSLVDE